MEEATSSPGPAYQPSEQAKPLTDWKAEARKWEKRARGNAAANAKLEAAQMEIEDLRAELAHEKESGELARVCIDVNAREGVPMSLLRLCGSKDDVLVMVDEWRQATRPKGLVNSRIVRHDG